jgi:hypothetical protein
MSEAVAELLAQVAPQQLLRVASRNLMLCVPRFDEEVVWGLLTDRHVPDETAHPPAVRPQAVMPLPQPMITAARCAEAA